VTWRDVAYILPIVLPGLSVVFLMRWRLNLLSLNDDTAFSLGTTPGRERIILLIAAVAATAAITSVAGIVGWVGLIVPHIARRLCGANAQYNLPAAMLIGGLFVVVCDDLARTLLAGEIPLGILTALIGAVIFMLLMMRSTVKVSR
jgi:iron complex transport system permease protein